MRKLLKVFLSFVLSLSSVSSWGESDSLLHSDSNEEEAPIHRATASREELYLSYHERLALNYLIAGAGKGPRQKEELAQLLKAELIRQVLTPIQNREVHSFEEFIQAFKGDWPNALSIDKDLELIRKRPPVPFGIIYSAKPEIQKQINAFSQYRRDQAKILYQKSGISLDQIDDAILKAQALKMFDKVISSESLVAAQQLEFDRIILRLFDSSEKMIHYGFNKIQTMAVPRDMVQSAKISDELMDFVVEIMQDYFRLLSFSQKKQIIADILGADLLASPMETFEKFILGSGPLLQKFLQIIAGDDAAPELAKDFFKRIEDALPQLPPEVVAEIMEKAKVFHRIKSYHQEALGVGTLAQTHLGVILLGSVGNEQEVKAVIRYLKPGIFSKIEMDARILKELAPKIDSDPRIQKLQLPRIAPLVESLVQNVNDEKSIFDTKLRQKNGVKHYRRSILLRGKTNKFDLEIYAPGIMDAQIDSDFHIQNVGSGKKLDDIAEAYKHEIPDLKANLMTEIASLWFEEALFKSGFYHGDLHQGNFLIEIIGSKIIVTILDFGMGGILSERLRALILGFAAGTKLMEKEMIVKSIWGLEKEFDHKYTYEELSKLVEERLEGIRQSGKQSPSLNEWAIWATDLDIQFDNGFVGFNRGMAVIEKNLKRSKSLVTCEEIVRSMLIKYSPQILKSMDREFGKKWYDFVRPYIEYEKRERALERQQNLSSSQKSNTAMSCRKPTINFLKK